MLGDDRYPGPPPPYPHDPGLDFCYDSACPPHGQLPWSDQSPSGDREMRDDHISFMRTVKAFREYIKYAMSSREARLASFNKFNNEYREVLCIDLEATFGKYAKCIEANSEFFECICDASKGLFDAYWPNGTTVTPEEVPPPTPLDIDKVFSTLRQFVRDWSAEGAAERDAVYKPMLQTLEEHFPDVSRRSGVQILVPGAGLCRLVVELALRGFSAQGNEFSYHMLIAAHYIQNHVVAPGQHTIFPYVDNTCNLVERDHQFVELNIPDLCASEEVGRRSQQPYSFGELSMVAGDFTEVYAKGSQLKKWNAVVTCFFIDTAHNIVEYIKILYNLLVPGGIWVNCGPLLYHFAGNAEGDSIELSLSEVLTVAMRFGFVVRRDPILIDTTYTNNYRSMKQLLYRCAFFVLQRPPVDTREAA
ncbi:N2227-like protein, putative [Trypanosoma equiperdum]|uniref:carnosine N-methyltransferase n=2 Tax=Trypanozoon TaxID=39700 RepID=Q584B2_TRYB2|nr:hypothetical protein, conserved [Trypanosoma brucei brucei TREU927]AAX79801.1 hypothetical protein, conserved [Trypanosoma brucei]AAZ10926.1 hypothetical protein, conserved [Trypanosoma brucei brucei TREU927]SCU69143.1 N2227-like protein, putative [Trypanosoma equiperdum]